MLEQLNFGRCECSFTQCLRRLWWELKQKFELEAVNCEILQLLGCQAL